MLPPVAKVWCSVTSSQRKYLAALPSVSLPVYRYNFSAPYELGNIGVAVGPGKNVFLQRQLVGMMRVWWNFAASVSQRPSPVSA